MSREFKNKATITKCVDYLKEQIEGYRKRESELDEEYSGRYSNPDYEMESEEIADFIQNSEAQVRVLEWVLGKRKGF